MGDGGSGCSRGACCHLRLKEDKIIGNGKRGDGLMSYAAGDTFKPHEKNIECDKLDVNWCTGTGETANNFCIRQPTTNQVFSLVLARLLPGIHHRRALGLHPGIIAWEE